MVQVESQRYLLLPSLEHLEVNYLSGLQIFGFCMAFLGLSSCFLGFMDAVIFPTFYANDTGAYPIELSISNAYGFSLYTGVMFVITGALALRTIISERFTSLRKFYISTCFVLLLCVVYWCMFLVAVCSVGLSYSSQLLSERARNALLVVRVFTAANFGLIMIPCFTAIALYTRPMMMIHNVPCGSYFSQLPTVIRGYHIFTPTNASPQLIV